jgi:hypothetical protein
MTKKVLSRFETFSRLFCVDIYPDSIRSIERHLYRDDRCKLRHTR